jgi:hypothetical protein
MGGLLISKGEAGHLERLMRRELKRNLVRETGSEYEEMIVYEKTKNSRSRARSRAEVLSGCVMFDRGERHYL